MNRIYESKLRSIYLVQHNSDVHTCKDILNDIHENRTSSMIRKDPIENGSITSEPITSKLTNGLNLS